MAYGFGVLAGKKKYVLAVVAGLGVVAAYLVGDADAVNAAKQIFAIVSGL